MRRDRETLDLFEPVYPVRRPASGPAALSFDGRLRRAISEALKGCPRSREEIAAEMAVTLERPTLSKAMIDAYSAESRTRHSISVTAFVALIRATGQTWLLDVVAEACGCVVLEGEEARLAERGRLLEARRELDRLLKELDALGPVKVRRQRGGR